MASVNKVILIGNLGKDPDVRYFSETGLTFASLTIATTSRRRDPEGNYNEETDWHRVAVFGKQAEFVKNYLKKGSQVYVEGRIKYRKYDKDGQTFYFTEILADTLQILGRKSDNENLGNPRENPTSSSFNTPPPSQSVSQGFEQSPTRGMGQNSSNIPQENKTIDAGSFEEDDIPF